MFNDATSTNLSLVDTGDGAQKKAAVMGGHLDAMIDPLNAVIQDDAAGLLKVIAVFAPERLKQAPDVPTAVEQGFDVTLAQANGFMFPAGTPDDVVESFCSTLGEVASSPEFQEQMDKLSVEVNFLAGQEYADYMSDLYARIGELAAGAGF